MSAGRDLTPLNQRKWLESKLETEARKRIRVLDGESYKFTSPARRSVPDRLICLHKIRPFFVEFKRWGEVPTAGQLREASYLLALGNMVYFIDNLHDFDTVVSYAQRNRWVKPSEVSPPGIVYQRFWETL